MSFIHKVMDCTEKGFEATAEAVEEVAAHHHAARLFLKLGIAVYAEERLNGSHEPVDRILTALEGHLKEHGEVGLDHLRAAHEVLGKDFVKEHAEAEAAPAE
jgi:hypothetical protein